MMGFMPFFFYKQWGIIEGAICNWVKKIFNENPIKSDMNNILIVPILKVQNLKTFG